MEDIYEEGLEYTDEIISEITGGRCTSWGVKSRLLAFLLTAKYNVLFRLVIYNWFLIAHNSRILKEMALLLYTKVTGHPFNLGNFIFEKITEETTNSATVSHLGYPVLIIQY